MPQEGEGTPGAEGGKPEGQGEQGQEPTQQAKPTGFDSLPPETQAEIKSLRAEATKHRKEAQEAQAKAQQFEDAQKSDLEKAQSKAEKAEKAQTDAELKLLRYEVAREKEVPAKLVPLLTADTKAELESQADLILENASTTMDGGARKTAPSSDMDTLIRSAAGRT